jgi:ATP-binding cassette subfamily E protein 1
MVKTWRTEKGNGFRLKVESGVFNDSEIVVFLGENGMGKTTMVGLISGLIKPDGDEDSFPEMSVSLKPQKILPKFKGTVRELFMSKIRSSFMNQSFVNDVIKPLNIEYTYSQPVKNLSGGELQRIAIVMCLGKEASLYLIDEPSAYLDSDQRIAISKVIKKYIYANKKTAFIVEHDLIVGTYLADKVVVFEGSPGVSSTASPPMALVDGMNIFLKKLNVTFRRDPINLRPRVNKPNSAKDREQKEKNRYFFT